MPRPPRFLVPGVPVHVIHRGNNRGRVFFTPADRSLFAALAAAAFAREGVALHAYVFMDNHIHLLVTPRTADALPLAMKSLGVRYGQYINRTYERTGTLWEGRYRACPIEDERYLFTCMRYLDLNPVRAGLVAAPAEFPWSSHRAYAAGASDQLVTPHDLYAALGASPTERQAAYRALFDQPMSGATLDEIRTATQHGWPLGSDVFKAALGNRTGARTTPRRRRGLGV